MKNPSSHRSAIFAFIFLISLACTFSKLILINEDYHLRSSDFEYPNNNETLDVVWMFSHSVRLKINEFHLNGHMGDFVLISEYPLLDLETLLEKNGTDDYVDDLAMSIVTEQGLLLSWMVDHEMIEAINSQGTFVLFHTEEKEPNGTAEFKGFDIEVVDYDALMTTTTSTTPDPVISPMPGQGNNYISKFLICKPPMEFFNNTMDFKNRVAKIATEFCRENGIPLEKGDIRGGEVNIPGPNEGQYAGLHYCDTSWPTYPTCVEVTFAIDRVDSEGKYILPAFRLEEMWFKKAESLRPFGYCPYNPAEQLADLNTLMFIVFFCGVIVTLSAIVACARCRNTILHFRKAAAASGDSKVRNLDEVDDKPHSKHYDDKANPMTRVVLRKDYYPAAEFFQRDDMKRPGGQKSRFENISTDVRAYDNSGFQGDDGGPSSSSKAQDSLLQRKGNRKLIMSSTGGEETSEI